MDRPETQKPCCDGEELVLVGTAPQVGPFPELRTFRCSRCGHVQTIEAAPVEPTAPTH
jgi:hypothetical protein